MPSGIYGPNRPSGITVGQLCDAIGYSNGSLNPTVDQTTQGLVNAGAGRVIEQNYFGVNATLGRDIFF